MKSVIEMEWETFTYDISEITNGKYLNCCFIVLESYS
jgi:hypothetical protein